MRAILSVTLLALSTAACTDYLVDEPPLVNSPTNLTYAVEPSGTPGSPSGVVLHWDFDSDSNIEVWNVYSRGSTGDSYGLRGSTTSNSFHDNGIPHLQYYVTAQDFQGNETAPSNVVTVDERLALDRPASLTTTSLSGAIALTWSDNAYQAEPAGFSIYRVYSASYDLDQNLCGVTWSLEGSSVAPEFISSALTNGVPR